MTPAHVLNGTQRPKAAPCATRWPRLKLPGIYPHIENGCGSADGRTILDCTAAPTGQFSIRDDNRCGTVPMTPDTGSVFGLTAAEKLQLVEDLWDDVSSRPEDVPVHPWQLAEVERRRTNLASRPESALSWDEMTARLRELHRGG